MGLVESKNVASPNTVNNRTVEPTQVKKEVGDLIEIFRGNNQHWAIYLGRGDVIHFSVPPEHAGMCNNSSGMVSGNNVKAIVKKEKLLDVVGKDRYYVNNLLDNKYKPRPLWDILQDAHSLLGQELPYSLLCDFVTDLRYGKPESRQEAQVEKEAGDLIEIFRGAYQHWAIYVGWGDLIHFSVLPEHAGKGIVTKEKLRDVVGNDRYSVNNLLDKKYKPRPLEEILKDAESRVGQKLPYSLLTSNCEHFVTDLRYGKAESRQVQEAAGAGAGFISGAFLASASVAIK